MTILMPCRHINHLFTLLIGLQKTFTVTKPGEKGNFYSGPWAEKDLCSGILGNKQLCFDLRGYVEGGLGPSVQALH